MTITGISFREGSIADLQETFAISERTVYEAAASQGILPPDRPPTDAQVRGEWRRQRALIEFLAAQPGGRYEICEDERRGRRLRPGRPLRGTSRSSRS